jgi:hypothetical protein
MIVISDVVFIFIGTGFKRTLFKSIQETGQCHHQWASNSFCFQIIMVYPYKTITPAGKPGRYLLEPYLKG